ncbi:MAG: hypothetical protein BWY17_04710 [Deltaproteobacteria bacterium ADurb.Bin207]|nr:MAG: hypothetical protein BWY17_04710 [Deltaproteobacteria bacterium ADurb.Bin207]
MTEDGITTVLDDDIRMRFENGYDLVVGSNRLSKVHTTVGLVDNLLRQRHVVVHLFDNLSCFPLRTRLCGGKLQ